MNYTENLLPQKRQKYLSMAKPVESATHMDKGHRYYQTSRNTKDICIEIEDCACTPKNRRLLYAQGIVTLVALTSLSISIFVLNKPSHLYHSGMVAADSSVKPLSTHEISTANFHTPTLVSVRNFLEYQRKFDNCKSLPTYVTLEVISKSFEEWPESLSVHCPQNVKAVNFVGKFRRSTILDFLQGHYENIVSISVSLSGDIETDDAPIFMVMKPMKYLGTLNFTCSNCERAYELFSNLKLSSSLGTLTIEDHQFGESSAKYVKTILNHSPYLRNLIFNANMHNDFADFLSEINLDYLHSLVLNTEANKINLPNDRENINFCSSFKYLKFLESTNWDYPVSSLSDCRDLETLRLRVLNPAKNIHHFDASTFPNLKELNLDLIYFESDQCAADIGISHLHSSPTIKSVSIRSKHCPVETHPYPKFQALWKKPKLDLIFGYDRSRRCCIAGLFR